jgi:Cupin domain
MCSAIQIPKGLENVRTRVVETTHEIPGAAALFAADKVIEARALPTGRHLVDLWRSEELLPGMAAGRDAAGALFPALNGVRFWQLVIPPDDSTQLPPFHATETIDFGVVTAGRVILELDGGQAVHLDQGDTFVQRGTAHRWVNPTGEDAVLTVVIVGNGDASSPVPHLSS